MALQLKTMHMSRGKKVMASAIGILALPVLAWPSPAHADFTVCNKTSKTVWVAYGYLGAAEGDWVSKGWRKLRGGGHCEMLVASSETSDPTGYFFYADGWEGKQRFCTTQQSFRIVGARSCADHVSDREQHELGQRLRGSPGQRERHLAEPQM